MAVINKSKKAPGRASGELVDEELCFCSSSYNFLYKATCQNRKEYRVQNNCLLQYIHHNEMSQKPKLKPIIMLTEP